MCIAIASRKGAILTDAEIQNCGDNNSDGWGIMGLVEGQLRCVRGMETSKAIEAFQMFIGCPYIAHFRYATHGSVCLANTHPFQVLDDLWMVHNGIISIPETYKDRPDSYQYARWLGSIMDSSRQVRSRFAQEIMGNAIGGSKLAFIDSTGTISIVNEKKGAWVHKRKIWVSNTTSLQPERQYGNYNFARSAFGLSKYNYSSGWKKEPTVVADSGYIYTTSSFTNAHSQDESIECDYCGMAAYPDAYIGPVGEIYCKGCRNMLIDDSTQAVNSSSASSMLKAARARQDELEEAFANDDQQRAFEGFAG